MSKELYLGIDIGSVANKIAILDSEGNFIHGNYSEHRGDPVKVLCESMVAIAEFLPYIATATVTGTGKDLISQILHIEPVNEIVTLVEMTHRFYPQVRTVIEIGGEDSKFIILDPIGNIQDFAMNTLCAAGTGLFLDQQASRLGLTLDQMSQLALKAKYVPRIAGRCSVFAKTDMIHLQQKGVPEADIIAGLCYALVRNFRSIICQGKNFIKPILFCGGVAKNLCIRKAFVDIFALTEQDFIIPENYLISAAIGAALMSLRNSHNADIDTAISKLKDYITIRRGENHVLEKLLSPDSKLYSVASPGNKQGKHQNILSSRDSQSNQSCKMYLGIDVGSVSTNLVLIDENKNILSKQYLPTAGKPIEAICEGLKRIKSEVNIDKINICGVCTTGSGRYLAADFVGGDIVKNEITAQARAAYEIDPEVDTIFEIGGQDSKFISLKNGIIVDFEMNKVCAAGTGSFLEEQAEKLGLSIEKEFADLAFQAQEPAKLGDKCTVFMESDLVHHQQQGKTKEDLCAGLAYSIVHNYLNRVVGNKKIGNNIFFQGGVAFNKAVVAAFEKVTNKKITVPEHHEVTGAIGCSLIARESKIHHSKFRGFDLVNRKYTTSTFECTSCPNMCEISEIVVENEEPVYYGSICGKYESKKTKTVSTAENIFTQRDSLLQTFLPDSSTLPDNNDEKKSVGIPVALFNTELLPLWYNFFHKLGFKVILSDKTNRKMIYQAVESVSGESCFPVKVTHGHIFNLLSKNIDYIFLPSLISLEPEIADYKKAVFCPYIQSLPYIIKAAINPAKEIIQPIIKQNKIVNISALSKQLRKTPKEIVAAYEAAMVIQKKFSTAMKIHGKEILATLHTPAVVLIGRPYNIYDTGINMNLPAKLYSLGVTAIPLDYVNLREENSSWENMYWYCGQRILAIAEYIKHSEKLFPIYLTNYGCGPDSFITKYFVRELANKPNLIIELDEHNADVGIMTRCEAFLDTISNFKPHKTITPAVLKTTPIKTFPKRRTIWIPKMSDCAYGIRSAAIFCDLQAEVFEGPDDESLAYGRKYTTGRECYPCILTTGEMIKLLKEKNASEIAFFMPTATGPCRFGQYYRFQQILLNELGNELGYKSTIPVYAPNQDINFIIDFIKSVGIKFIIHAWKGVVAITLLDKISRKKRPYEKEYGQTDILYKKYLTKICTAIEKGKSLIPILKEIKDAFSSIETISENNKPVIGIVGEIYIRSTPFSNNFIIQRIEKLGGEVLLPPVTEWIFYTNFLRSRNSLHKKDIISFLINALANKYAKFIEHKYYSYFADLFDQENEIKQLLQFSKPFIEDTFEGEAILSIGKSIDYIKKNVSGIINVMPLTCMPGTIVAIISKRIRQECKNIPWLNIAYDGLEQTNTQVRLEAFLYQAKEYKNQQLQKKR